jgi:hypothetical protein
MDIFSLHWFAINNELILDNKYKSKFYFVYMTICEYLHDKIKRIKKYISDFFEENDYEPLHVTPTYHVSENYNIL